MERNVFRDGYIVPTFTPQNLLSKVSPITMIHSHKILLTQTMLSINNFFFSMLTQIFHYSRNVNKKEIRSRTLNLFECWNIVNLNSIATRNKYFTWTFSKLTIEGARIQRLAVSHNFLSSLQHPVLFSFLIAKHKK